MSQGSCSGHFLQSGDNRESSSLADVTLRVGGGQVTYPSCVQGAVQPQTEEGILLSALCALCDPPEGSR